MIIVLSWSGWVEDLKIERAGDADLAKARSYIDAMPSDRTAFVFDADQPLEQQLESLTYNGSRLVELYNATLGPDDQRVTKFQDRTTAVRRIGLRLVSLAREAQVVKFSEEKREMAREPARIGAFKPIGKNTNLGKVVAAYQDGTTNLDDVAASVGLSTDKVVSVLRSARGSNGVDHSVAKGELTLTIPSGIEVFKQAKEPTAPKAPRAPKFGEFSQVRADSRLGKIVAASPATAADIGVLVDPPMSADDVLLSLKRARVSHGIDHSVAEDGTVSIFAHQMPADTVLIKPPATKSERAGGGTKSTIADDATITLLVDKNPKRPTASAYARFALYRTGQTVAEFLAAGGTKADLSWDRAHDFIRIDAPAAEQTQQAAE